MSTVPLRSFAVLAVLIVAGCKAADSIRPIAPASDCGTTGKGVQHHDTPVVCVDGSGTTLAVHPNSIRVWDVGSSDHATPPTIQWVTRGGGNLQIAMKDAGCVETPKCSGPHCSATVKGGIGAGRHEGEMIQQCRYKVTLDGRVLDPDTVIVRCCSDAPPE